MTRREFLADSKPSLVVTIDGQAAGASLKEFSTGSAGYNANGKVKIPNAKGELVTYQLSLNLIAVGSKEHTKE